MKKIFLILIICAILILHWFTCNTNEMIQKGFSHENIQTTQKENLSIEQKSHFK